MEDENRTHESCGHEILEVVLPSICLFIEKPGLLKYRAVEFGSIFCCVYRPVREKGVWELLL